MQMSARALEEMGYETDTVRTLIASERETEYQMADENVSDKEDD